MGANLRKLLISGLMAGLAAVVLAPSAEANRGNTTTTTTTTRPDYTPPPQFEQNPNAEGPVVDPSTGAPTEPTVVPIELPVVTDPGAGLAGGGDQLAPAPTTDHVLSGTDSRPSVPAAPVNEDGIFGGILSRTGAETLPLARAGVGVLAFGLGLVILARRRDPASA